MSTPGLTRTKGFTLIELLVVIAILGFLATVLLGNLNVARDQGRAANAVLTKDQIVLATEEYLGDTGKYPCNCVTTCDASPTGDHPDPFLNSFSVAGWKGPYYRLYDTIHGWGGHVGIISTWDIDVSGNGLKDFGIVFNDDRPGTDPSDNGGRIPTRGLLALDRLIDDGNLSTGRLQGNNQGFLTTGFIVRTGEAIYIVDKDYDPKYFNPSCPHP